jgi:ribonuclease D
LWFRRELAITGRRTAHPCPDRDRRRDELLYIKAFATDPEHQQAIARAAKELVAEQSATMGATGEVLVSDDGLRVWLTWRWRGSRRELLAADAEVVRKALARHPVFAQARVVEARVLRAAP